MSFHCINVDLNPVKPITVLPNINSCEFVMLLFNSRFLRQILQFNNKKTLAFIRRQRLRMH